MPPRGMAICEYPLKKGHGFADYLLHVDGAAVGAVEVEEGRRSADSS
jgi:type I restriction enzyme, R subunit